MLGGQSFHLVLCETKETRHITWFHHGVFLEVVERRLCLELLDRQDSRHIDPGEHIHAGYILEHTAQEVQVFVHHLGFASKLTADGIPLVDDEDEMLASLDIDALEIGH